MVYFRGVLHDIKREAKEGVMQLSAFLFEVKELIFPSICVVCGAALVHGEQFICTDCRCSLPLNDGVFDEDERIYRKLEEVPPPDAIITLFKYQKKSDYHRLIHALKFNSQRKLADYMGQYLGVYLQSRSNWDLIVPVPLYIERLRQREYNQAADIAQGIGRVLAIPVCSDNLCRQERTKVHSHLMVSERYEGMEDVFVVHRFEEFVGKRILLVDDIITSGATMYGCAKALMKIDGVRWTYAALGHSVVDL